MVLLILTAITFSFGFGSWLIIQKFHTNLVIRNTLIIILSILAAVDSIVLSDYVRELRFLENHKLTFLVPLAIITMFFFIKFWYGFSRWILVAGISSNILVIASNGLKMPVFQGWYSYKFASTGKELDDMHFIMTQPDNFKFLADFIDIRITLPYYEIANVWSPGDFLMVIGSFLLYKSIFKAIFIRPAETN